MKSVRSKRQYLASREFQRQQFIRKFNFNLFLFKKKHFLHTLLKNQTYLTLQIIFHYILSVSVHDEFNESYILNANLLNLGTIHQRIIHIIYEVLRVNMKDELKK